MLIMVELLLNLQGDLSGATKQDVNLYSTRLKVTDTTKLHVAHKGGKGTKVYVEFATRKIIPMVMKLP